MKPESKITEKQIQLLKKLCEEYHVDYESLYVKPTTTYAWVKFLIYYIKNQDDNKNVVITENRVEWH